MGWLWGSSADETSLGGSSKKSEYEAPDRLKRVKCWDSRDAYFQCLDKNNILDALQDSEAADKACNTESRDFDSNCAKSWVKYFKQRRVAEYQKEQLLKKQADQSLPLK